MEMSHFARTIMERKYAHDKSDGSKETWENIAHRVTKNVMRAVGVDMRTSLAKSIRQAIVDRKFIPAGRYLYAAGNQVHQISNCFSMRAHDSREGWSEILHNASMALMTGGGVGIVYSDIRHEGARIRKTGGAASGPLPLIQIVNELGRGIIQGGDRRCLPYDAPVTMADGNVKPIEQIKIGDLVHTPYGPRRVTAVFDQGVQEVFKITTTKGNLYSTENHRWYGTTKMRKPMWVTTKKVKPGWKIYRSNCPVSKGIPKNKSWMYTLGFFLGNGCAYHSNRTWEVTFQIADAHICDTQVKCIEKGMKRFNANMCMRKGHGACTELRFRSKPLVSVFQEYKTPKQPFHIPAEVWEADLESRAAFMAGWLDADGDVRKDEKVRLFNKHLSVVNEAVEFFNTLGFNTTVSKLKRCYQISLSARQRNLFNTLIAPWSFKYLLTSSDKPDLLLSKVISVEPWKRVQTYDIEVEDVHQFVAYGSVSHNSAIWAGLNWKHPDVMKFIRAKDWPDEVRQLKAKDFSFPATLDQTNISVLFDDEFFEAYYSDKHPLYPLAHNVFWICIERALKTGEPGFSIDINENVNEVLRNPCCEFTSDVPDNVCNLGSLNFAKIESLEDLQKMLRLSTALLLAGTVYTTIPYKEVDKVISKNREIGLGIMGIHEWLLSRGKPYAPDPVLGEWLAEYSRGSRKWANKWAKEWGLKRPRKTRAIAPNGTTAIVAETTGGIEPIFCLTPETKVLQSNLDWKQIDSLLVGDTLVGFRETPLDFRSNKFQASTVISKEEITQPCYKITTDKGSVECSVNHLWVAREKLPVCGQTRKGQGWKWKPSNTLKPGMEIAFAAQPWERDISFDGGWLSGMFDGEGFLGGPLPRHGVRMSICQNEGPVLDRLKRLLTEREIDFAQDFIKGTCYKLTPQGKWNALRILGMVNPKRLTHKIPVLLGSLKLCGKYSIPATILKIQDIGHRKVIALGTSTKTLIANGFLSHNCVAYKRRYLKGGVYCAQYVIDPVAKRLIESGVDPDSIEDAYDLARNPERRVAFQAWVQQYVDHAISSTVNLPAWGNELNNANLVREFGEMLLRYLPKLRGITVYPDGGRAGQPLNPVPYEEAVNKVGKEIVEEQMDVCSLRGGSCGD